MRRTVAAAMAAPLVMAPVMATPAAADTIVLKRKVERSVGTGFKQQAGVKVRVKCPKRVTWEKGKVYYCKVRTRSGERYRVKVKLGSAKKGAVRWKVVA
jgi:hypothetical protein